MTSSWGKFDVPFDGKYLTSLLRVIFDVVFDGKYLTSLFLKKDLKNTFKGHLTYFHHLTYSQFILVWVGGFGERECTIAGKKVKCPIWIVKKWLRDDPECLARCKGGKSLDKLKARQKKLSITVSFTCYYEVALY